MVSMRTVEISVGVFMMMACAALAILAFKVSGLSLSDSKPTYKLVAYFDNVSGLTNRAKVSAAGVIIGNVTNIQLDPKTYRARVEMRIFKDAGQFTTDTSAAIQTSGLLGEKYISFSIGGEDDYLEDGGVIQDTQSSLVLEELIGKLMASFIDKKPEPASESVE